jgi:hypothetical protein
MKDRNKATDLYFTLILYIGSVLLTWFLWGKL